ncbi:hypothetical protein CIL05_12965 [Virgibacillus profundi]|uniref:DUF3267 domain-containing protein n=1 Tax=Virgibacillus profundi TaxID=2024555 RepID=A0A2A2IDU6_9BACI|nr:DUF3267 domain-containing protein [Virgibacillus profundi]PAV29300.1 hypothetical protein CIL05_12965 [Virgibacillus profundi]PXY53469.1 DUF3267 domain-containing protein [Virgibacillus profundi]
MNCWKSINFNKEFGHNRIKLVSFLIGLLAFIFLYVPISIAQQSNNVNEAGFLPLMIALLLLPSFHSFMHILPLIIMNKRVKVFYQTKIKFLPVFNYYTKNHLTKKVSLIVALAPTFLITIPGIAASYIYADFYFYLLLFTSIHIGISFIDFLYAIHIIKAPKKAFIENRNNGIDILLKARG